MLSNRIGKKIARQLGVEYKGIQKGFQDVPDFYWFEDPVTGSSFAGDDLQDAEQTLQDMRIKFGVTKEVD